MIEGHFPPYEYEAPDSAFVVTPKLAEKLKELLKKSKEKEYHTMKPEIDFEKLRLTPEQLTEFHKKKLEDAVNHPKHYNSHQSGIECIQVTEHFNFCLGNAVKYIWRAGEKDGNTKVQDLQKALWYIEREIKRLEKLKCQ